MKIEMGGEGADLDISEGGKTSASLATLPADGPTGGYFHMGQPIPWQQKHKRKKLMKISNITAGILLLASLVQPLSAADMQERPAKDLSLANGQIHWPKGFNPKEADAFVHNEIWINAPADVIWTNLVNTSDMQIGSADRKTLQADTTFTWKTLGFPILSKVNEFSPYKRLGWFGSGTGIRAYHTRLIVEKVGGSEVITEEAQVCPSAIKYNIEQPTAMQDGHNWWLTALKYRSEHSTSK